MISRTFDAKNKTKSKILRKQHESHINYNYIDVITDLSIITNYLNIIAVKCF